MAEKENLTRWVWDLFPLSKDSWGDLSSKNGQTRNGSAEWSAESARKRVLLSMKGTLEPAAG